MLRRHPHRGLAAIVAAALAALAATPAWAQAPVPATNGTITTVAGTQPGFAGDGGPAKQAKVDTPRDLAYTASGSFLIADFNNDRIREVGTNGIINTVAGSSTRGFAGDGGPATAAELNRPRGVTVLPGGGYLVADTFNNRIRRVGADGTISTIAGSTQGLSGDGGPATAAQLSNPSSMALEPDGSVLIADTGNSRIRKIALDGTITTIAGTTQGAGGDGGPATVAQLNQPRDVAVAPDGSILIADTGNNRIRRIAPDGTITTVAGTDPGLAGDGDPASSAKLNGPFSVVPLTNGGFAFADTGNSRVRRVTPLGAIFTVVGTTPGNSGNGGLAKNAQLNQPGALANAPGGGFLVADTTNATIRRVSDIGAVPPAVVNHSVGLSPFTGNIAVRPAEDSGFLALHEQDLVPVGSAIDATSGTMNVTTAVDSAGAQLSAQLYSGAFTVTQAGVGQPFTNFRLAPLSGCVASTRSVRTQARDLAAVAARTKAKKKKPAAKKRGPTSHQLWVSERGGHWRTSTGSVSAAAVGTVWHTTLSCAGTRITVVNGIVEIRDRFHKLNVTLHAGQTYLATTKRAHQGE